MMRTTLRTARKHHRCHCGRSIDKGERHWEMVAVDEDFMDDGWWRIRECSDCANRYGRPVSDGGEDRP